MSKVEWFREHAGKFGGSLLFDEPLARYTYYQIGGPAQILATPRLRDDLHWLQEGIAQSQIPFFILGKGSNLLVSDEGFPGLVIRTNQLNVEVEPIDSILRTGGSVVISALLRKAAQEGWGGLEFLTGIPGTIGGAVRMNAGTHLGETQSRLIQVEAYSFLSGSTELFSHVNNPLKFQYRENLFLPQTSLVWSADWKIDKRAPNEVKTLIDATLVRRKATQPVEYPSCGSVFKNPTDGVADGTRHAWQVIDRLGLRGHQIGMAQFSLKHSNFIINLGGAKATDVSALIQLAKKRAASELGITLNEEVIYISP